MRSSAMRAAASRASNSSRAHSAFESASDNASVRRCSRSVRASTVASFMARALVLHTLIRDRAATSTASNRSASAHLCSPVILNRSLGGTALCCTMSRTGSDTRSYTYAELAAVLGTGVPSVRNLVRRKRWHKITGNDKLVRIVVPIEYVERQRAAPPSCAAHDPGHGAARDPAHDPAPDVSIHTALQVLTRHIERLEAELDPLRSMPAQVA